MLVERRVAGIRAAPHEGIHRNNTGRFSLIHENNFFEIRLIPDCHQLLQLVWGGNKCDPRSGIAGIDVGELVKAVSAIEATDAIGSMSATGKEQHG